MKKKSDPPLRSDLKWFVILPFAIVLGLGMPWPLGLVQTIVATALLVAKTYKNL